MKIQLKRHRPLCPCINLKIKKLTFMNNIITCLYEIQPLRNANIADDSPRSCQTPLIGFLNSVFRPLYSPILLKPVFL